MVLQGERIIKEDERTSKEINEDKELKELKELQEQYTELKKTNAKFKTSETNGTKTRLTKSDDGGYTSSCSSNGHQLEEGTFIVEQTICLETINGSELSSDGEQSKKQSKVFQESFNSFLELTADDKIDEPNVQAPLLNGHLDEEVDVLVQLQRQLENNANQLNHVNSRLKLTAGICEREIREIKTFLLCLDKRNSDLIKKTTKTKAELYERIKKLEGDVRFVKMDQKEIPALSQKISSFEKKQIGIENSLAELKEPVTKNTQELASLLARIPMIDNNTTCLGLNKQMDNIETRLTKVFFAFFIMIFAITLAMTFWMNRGGQTSTECQHSSSK